jgi:Na+/H+-dicarboxylate symporter
LTGRVQAWTRGRLWLQVIAGLVLGIIIGAVLGPDFGWVSPETGEIVGAWIALPGKIFLGLISMVLLGLVFGSIIQGLTGSQGGKQLGSVGLKFTVFVVITTTFAATLGMSLALNLEPGSYIELPPEMAVQTATLPQVESTQEVRERVPDLIAELIPANPAAAAEKRDLLAMVILAILVGIACNAASRQRVEIFLRFLDGVVEVSMVIIKWAMFLAPWAVFGLTAQLVIRVGLSTIGGMFAYVFTVIVGLLGLLILYLLLVAFVAKRNPMTFLSNIASPMLLAFSTSSSAAVMPLSIDTAVKRLGVRENIAGLIIPLGATVNMAGTALYQSVAVIFLAQMSGVDLSTASLVAIIVTLVASSIGAPGTPGVAVVILTNIVGDFGIPTAGLALILGVDRILDMCRTSVNLTGDLTACVLIGGRGSSASGTSSSRGENKL